jgi:voltage-gated potassium channel
MKFDLPENIADLKRSRHERRTNIWRFVVSICASFTALYMPLEYIFNFKNDLLFYISTIFISLIYIIDIFISLLNTRFKKGEEVLDRHNTRSYYLKHFLVTDIISAIPFDLFFNHPVCIIFRFLKLYKVNNFMYQTKQNEFRYVGYLTFLFFSFWLIHSVHWIGCGWLTLVGIDPSMNNISNYIQAMYWTSTTLTGTGYGDIVAITNLQRIYAILVQFFGFGVLGFLIGNIASMLTKKDPAKSQYLENMEKLNNLIHYRELHPELENRIKDYYTYLWKKRLGFDEGSFLAGLPKNLKTDVALYLKKDVVEKIPLFKDADSKFIEEIAIFLRPLILTPGDRIFEVGDEGKEMYFIVKGNLRVLSKEGKLLAVLSDGDFFGEVALFNNDPRNASVEAVGYCDLYILEKNEFNQVLYKYPEIAGQMAKKAKQREG